MDRKWQFVHSTSGGWWLRLSSDEDIIRYIQATNDRYDGALCMAVHNPLNKMSLEDRISAMLDPDSRKDLMQLQAATIMAQRCNTTLYGGFERMQTEFGMALHRDIEENGETFVNRVGGKTFALDFDQFVWRENLVFPSYKLSDIRIKQFPGGEHYYAYVGDVQIRQGDILKWGSYSEAYDYAKYVVAN